MTQKSAVLIKIKKVELYVSSHICEAVKRNEKKTYANKFDLQMTVHRDIFL